MWVIEIAGQIIEHLPRVGTDGRQVYGILIVLRGFPLPLESVPSVDGRPPDESVSAGIDSRRRHRITIVARDCPYHRQGFASADGMPPDDCGSGLGWLPWLLVRPSVPCWQNRLSRKADVLAWASVLPERNIERDAQRERKRERERERDGDRGALHTKSAQPVAHVVGLRVRVLYQVLTVGRMIVLVQ